MWGMSSKQTKALAIPSLVLIAELDVSCATSHFIADATIPSLAYMFLGYGIKLFDPTAAREFLIDQ